MYPNIAAYQKIKGSTKDKIIEILSYDWPLTIRKIFYMLKKHYGSNVTYQAVHKAMVQMIMQKIITKSAEGYRLDLDWVKDIHDQTEIIRINYFSESHASLFDVKKGAEAIRVFIFKSWFDVEKYFYYLQKNYILRSKNKQTICFHHNHEWRPLFYLRAEYNWVKKLVEMGHQVYTLCSGMHALDKWSKKFYESIGIKVKLGIKAPTTAELMVFSDLVIQMYIPLELKERLEKELRKADKINEIDLKQLIEDIFDKKTEIKVVINKDNSLAEEIKKQVLSRFRK